MISRDAVVDPKQHTYYDAHVSSVSRVFSQNGLIFVTLGSYTGVEIDGKPLMKEQMRLICSPIDLARIAEELTAAAAHLGTNQEVESVRSSRSSDINRLGDLILIPD